VYVKRNVQPRSRKLYFHGKSKSIKCYEFLYICILALVIWHENLVFSATYYIVICGLPAQHCFKLLSYKWRDFRAKKFIEHKMCFDLLYNYCLKQFSF